MPRHPALRKLLERSGQVGEMAAPGSALLTLVDDPTDARSMGADCVLLIVAALAPAQLADLHGLARGIGLDVLVEVHNARELDAALALDNPMVGINNRDLHSFHTTLETTFSLLPRIGDGRLVVTESGIQRVDDVLAMRGHGVNAFLVGEAFMRAEDPGAQLRALFD